VFNLKTKLRRGYSGFFCIELKEDKTKRKGKLSKKEEKKKIEKKDSLINL
jgi:hypothetical protein